MLKQLVTLMTLTFFTINEIDASSCHGSGKTGAGDHSKKHINNKANNQIYTLRFQTVCPITENSVNRTIYADWEGDEKNTPKRIYLCCTECKNKFNNKPARHVRKLIKMGQHVQNNFQMKK